MRYFLEIVWMTVLMTAFVGGQRQGDLCVVTRTGQPGVCRHIMKCPVALEAAFHGIPRQECVSPENRFIVCCPWVPGQETGLQAWCQANTTTPREGDNCTMVDTGRAGVCSRFANCQTAKDAAFNGIFPQICGVEGSTQIICCPLVTVAEGDQCSTATGRTGKCLRISKCPVAVEAALKGKTPQICVLDGSVPVVCCEGVVEGDACTIVDTGKTGVCRPFANCQTAKEAAYKGILPQTCDVEGTVQTVCCPLSTIVEGSQCAMLDTGRAGVCRPFANCQTAKEASYKGILPQTCHVEGAFHIICCPLSTVVQGSNCTMLDTGKAGVCKPFADCQTAKEASYKGIWPQICGVEGSTQIICCPLVTVAEGDQCSTATGRTGKCLRISKCPVAVEAALKGKTPQICVLDGSVPVVCCEGVVEGDACTIVDTGKTGVCRPFANCQTAKEAAYKGILPQTCDVEGTVQTVCCPLSTIVEGSQCAMLDTGRAGVCRPFANCQTAKEASYKGILPQTCHVEGAFHIICCPLSTVVQGSNCTMLDTGKAGVCKPFADCQTAKEASYKGIWPQTCNVEGTVQAVCCPPSTIVEGSICTVKNTRIAGVYKPFANCQTAMMAASEGTLPQISASEDNIQIVCCPTEGSNCTLMDTGMAGVCKLFANCRRAKKAAGRGFVPQKCDLTDNESELVCCAETDCPPLPKGLVTQLPVGSKAADYCIELAEKIHPCQETRSGWTRGETLCPLLTPDSNKVYHKTPMTTTAEAPYFGQIGTGQRGAITWREYPVSLVSDQWVLCSATAIIVSIGSSNVKFVGLGGTFTPRYNPDEIFGVITQRVHPLYDLSYSYSYNNIALLQLDRRVTFTARILPVCLHTGTPLPDSGFILTGRGYPLTEHKTTMQRVSQEECSRVVPTNRDNHPAGVKHDQEICSRPVNTTERCGWGWYYGSPLTLHNSHKVACTHLLVGLESNHESPPCTVTSTRISSFIPWIEGIVWT